MRFPSAVRHEPAIDCWMRAQRDDLRPLVEEWFARMRQCGGDVRELMHDGHPTACVGDAAFGYVDAFRDHVNVGFFLGALLEDPAHLLEGTGKRMRHVKLRPGRAVNAAALGSLIDAAYADIRRRIGKRRVRTRSGTDADGAGAAAAGAAEGPSVRARPGTRTFERTEVWVFDLDNTLYPADSRLFAQVDRRMGEFIARYLGVPFAYARHLQKSYYRQFGTTLTGLMQVHRMDPKPFLDYVHDLDLSELAAHPRLAAAIRRLPGRKLIFTNGSRAHAERIVGKLGLLELFDGIFDIVAADYVPKPVAASYEAFVKAHGVDATRAAMFEDMPHNLEAPHTLGMTTVLVRSDANDDHPTHRAMLSWAAPPAHVHHMTYDLTGFLEGVGGRPPSSSTEP